MRTSNLLGFIKDKNFLLFSSLLLSYGIFLSCFSVADFPSSLKIGFLPYLSDKPVGEDGFYMLDVAWNIANNKGISYSGSPTTGIQPLATFIYSILSWLNINFLGSNKWLLVRHIIFLGTITHIIFSYLIGCICSVLYKNKNEVLIFRISSTLALFSFGIYRLATYGLETGIYLLGFASFILFLLINLNKKVKLSKKQVFYLGSLSGLLILTRIDFIVILICIIPILFIQKLLSIKESILISLIAFSISSPWFYYVKEITGKYIPSSGYSSLNL